MSWLSLRRHIVPWCMHPGCWEPSIVFHKPQRHRGNLCAMHLWQKLQEISE